VYPSVIEFNGFDCKDTTFLACGFDYKLTGDSEFYCVEVKGLNGNNGGILMTEKEYDVAKELRNRYCLFIVRNFIHSPNHLYFFDPVNNGLSFVKNVRTVTQTSYSTMLL